MDSQAEIDIKISSDFGVSSHPTNSYSNHASSDRAEAEERPVVAPLGVPVERPRVPDQPFVVTEFGDLLAQTARNFDRVPVANIEITRVVLDGGLRFVDGFRREAYGVVSVIVEEVLEVPVLVGYRQLRPVEHRRLSRIC